MFDASERAERPRRRSGWLQIGTMRSELTEAAALAQRLRQAISDERVLAAIASIPRELFVPERERSRAYENIALPIACGQTISQPLVVARMIEMLAPRASDRVLDVGTGSGYHAALLALLAGHVWTIERHAALSENAKGAIAELGLDNISFFIGDGSQGLPDYAPFDAINVAAATGDAVPTVLEHQLAAGGRLAAPVGTTSQHLTLTRRTPTGFERERLEAVRFVPLVRGERDA
jgi:protein-L-isoaspartate(D-aspartate) O-methyltransferase